MTARETLLNLLDAALAEPSLNAQTNMKFVTLNLGKMNSLIADLEKELNLDPSGPYFTLKKGHAKLFELRKQAGKQSFGTSALHVENSSPLKKTARGASAAGVPVLSQGAPTERQLREIARTLPIDSRAELPELFEAVQRECFRARVRFVGMEPDEALARRYRRSETLSGVALLMRESMQQRIDRILKG